MSDSYPVKEIFADALEFSAAERPGFLDRVCAQDAAVRARVEQLLRVHAAGDGFLPGAEATADAEQVAGRRIGPYRLIEKLGEGGFGEVFLAEQTEPLVRRVALKIVKPGMDTRQVIARFEAERQALALMDHPGIARVFDAGATESGRPYFAMELVQGEVITEHCERAGLDTRARLELFEKVCHAVQHAHQKGVIHRDLKPGNVLVTETDGKPVPKVIDFGIAKSTAGPLTGRTLSTRDGSSIGTPEYMSPEQVGKSGTYVDTRSDVYSLGVLLYELLTRTTPFSARELREQAVDELERMIREVEPEKPSTRLAAITRALDPGAPGRSAELAQLASRVRGDLDCIVMKCLEKDRERRYETAYHLAQDVRRHLVGEPVVAAPPSAVYRARKFVRRHRFGVVAGVVIAAVLMLGSAGTAIGLVWAIRERGRAERAAQAEAEQRALAQANERTALEEARHAESAAATAALRRDQAEETTRFMREMLGALDPEVAVGRDTSLLREIIDGAAARIERGELDNAPEAELWMRLTIGDTYRKIAVYDRASEMLEGVEALARSQAPEAGDSILVWEALQTRAHLFESTGDVLRTAECLQQALDVAERLFQGDSGYVATSLNNVAQVWIVLGRPTEALPLLRRAMAMNERLLGEGDPTLAHDQANLGGLLFMLGRPAEAEPLLRRALEARRRTHSGDHPHLMNTLCNLGLVLIDLQRIDEAESMLQESLDICRRLYPKGAPDLAWVLETRAWTSEKLGRGAEAAALLRESLEVRERLFPGGHREMVPTLFRLASTLEQLGTFAEAEARFAQLVELHRRFLPDDLEQRAIYLKRLGDQRRALGRTAEAEATYVEALAILRAAEPLLLDAQAKLEHDPAVPPPGALGDRRREAVERIVRLYETWEQCEPGCGHAARAEPWRRKIEGR